MKGSMTIEASYIFPFCFLVIVIICNLGIFQYNQTILKTTGYESILLVTEEREQQDKILEQELLKKAEQMARERILGIKELEVTVKMTVSKITVNYQGRQRMFRIPFKVMAVYERTYPELTLRLLSGKTGGTNERTTEEGFE